MAEQINLTKPDQAVAGTTNYWIAALRLDWDSVRVEIQLNSAGGLRRSVSYSGDVAKTMMAGLNTANLSAKSLHKRIFERLVADGHLAGSVSGLPG